MKGMSPSERSFFHEISVNRLDNSVRHTFRMNTSTKIMTMKVLNYKICEQFIEHSFRPFFLAGIHVSNLKHFVRLPCFMRCVYVLPETT